MRGDAGKQHSLKHPLAPHTVVRDVAEKKKKRSTKKSTVTSLGAMNSCVVSPSIQKEQKRTKKSKECREDAEGIIQNRLHWHWCMKTMENSCKRFVAIKKKKVLLLNSTKKKRKKKKEKSAKAIILHLPLFT